LRDVSRRSTSGHCQHRLLPSSNIIERARHLSSSSSSSSRLVRHLPRTPTVECAISSPCCRLRPSPTPSTSTDAHRRRGSPSSHLRRQRRINDHSVDINCYRCRSSSGELVVYFQVPVRLRAWFDIYQGRLPSRCAISSPCCRLRPSLTSSAGTDVDRRRGSPSTHLRQQRVTSRMFGGVVVGAEVYFRVATSSVQHPCLSPRGSSFQRSVTCLRLLSILSDAGSWMFQRKTWTFTVA